MPTELIAIPRKVFRLALANDAFRERWLALLLRELRRLRAQNERLCLKTAEERSSAIEQMATTGGSLLNQSKTGQPSWASLTRRSIGLSPAWRKTGDCAKRRNVLQLT